MQMIVRRTAVAAAMCAVLAGCAGSEGGATSSECADVLQRSTYSVVQQLVNAQQLANPEQALDLASSVLRGTVDDYEMVDYGTFESLDDADRAQAMSAVVSSTTGVGSVFSPSTLAQDLDETDLCAGLIPR